VSAAQAEDVDKAVRAARAAFPAWRDLDPEKRARLMLRDLLAPGLGGPWLSRMSFGKGTKPW